MDNKMEVMAAIVKGNSNNERMIEDLINKFDVYGMLINYLRAIDRRNCSIEEAKVFWNDISKERIESENTKVVEDTKKICEIGHLLDKLKELIEE